MYNFVSMLNTFYEHARKQHEHSYLQSAVTYRRAVRSCNDGGGVVIDGYRIHRFHEYSCYNVKHYIIQQVTLREQQFHLN
jgi:hypothetical protein